MELEKSVQLLWASISIRCLDSAPLSLSLSLSLSRNLLSSTEVTKGNNGRSILEGLKLVSRE
jgi:hypothetical protein